MRRLFLIKIIMGLIAKFIFSPIVRSSRQLNYSQIIPCLLLCSNRQIKRHKHFFSLLLWKDLKEYILLQSRPTFWNVNKHCFMQELHYEYGWHIIWISLSIRDANFMTSNVFKHKCKIIFQKCIMTFVDIKVFFEFNFVGLCFIIVY